MIMTRNRDAQESGGEDGPADSVCTESDPEREESSSSSGAEGRARRRQGAEAAGEEGRLKRLASVARLATTGRGGAWPAARRASFVTMAELAGQGRSHRRKTALAGQGRTVQQVAMRRLEVKREKAEFAR